MYHTPRKNLIFGFAVLLGWVMQVLADRPAWSQVGEPILKPGIAIHSFGVSPDSRDVNADGNHSVVRLYNTTGRGYESGARPVYSGDTYSHQNWTLETLGNVYGIAIDKKHNIYVASSANWSSGYIGTGDGDGTVTVSFGVLGGGDNNNSAGVVYQLDAMDGRPKIWTRLPQTDVQITSQVCEGNANDITRQAGPGLGNVVYDIFHNQMFVSNFSDGAIYRLNMQGEVLDSFAAGSGLNPDNKTVIAPYGMAISNDGSKLYYGTMETNMHPRLYAIKLTKDGSFEGGPIDQKAKLGTEIQYTQNIGGNAVNDGVWAAYSDLDFTPDGNLLIGVRVGCNGNFATSYNHGGVVYMLKSDENGLYNQPADKVPGSGTTYTGEPTGDDRQSERTGWWYDDDTEVNYYNYDAGSIPLRPHNEGQKEEESLRYGPDDGYGGVAIWQTATGNNDYDIYATSGDIVNGEGVHGFMQFAGDFQLKSVSKTIKKVMAYKSVESTTTEDRNLYDYKGIGGDVEVLSVLPVSIGSYVWIDNDHDGKQNGDEDICLDGATVTLHNADNMENKVLDLAAKEVGSQTTADCGKYHFENLPEGNYRVCVMPPDNEKAHFAPTKDQNGADNDDDELDSNIKETINGAYCSGTFGVFANSEPVENENDRGDNADKAHDSWGNMTVDFGFVKHIFDLALIKKLDGDKTTFKPGDTVRFTITVFNQGDVNATHVKVADYIPEGLSLIEADGWTQENGIAIKEIGALPGGTDTEVGISFVIDKDFQGDKIVNNAEIAFAENDLNLTDIDSTPGSQGCTQDIPGSSVDNDPDHNATQCDDYDPAEITVEQHFDLALVKVVKGTKAKYRAGEQVTFVIAVKNQGTIDAKNVIIKDDIPKGLILDDSRWNADGTIKNPITLIKPNQTAYREITFKIASKLNNNAKITNIAEIEYAENDLGIDDDDSVPGENSCGSDMDHNNDINSTQANANGCDDVDPAWISISVPVVATDTYAPPEKTEKIPEEAPADTVEDCECNHVESNMANSMNMFMVFLMLAGTLVLAIGFAAKERESL